MLVLLFHDEINSVRRGVYTQEEEGRSVRRSHFRLRWWLDWHFLRNQMGVGGLASQQHFGLIGRHTCGSPSRCMRYRWCSKERFCGCARARERVRVPPRPNGRVLMNACRLWCVCPTRVGGCWQVLRCVGIGRGHVRDHRARCVGVRFT